MTSLTEFAALPLPELIAEIDRMLYELRAKHYPSTLPTVTRIGQATPSPADPAARGELIEVIA